MPAYDRAGALLIFEYAQKQNGYARMISSTDQESPGKDHSRQATPAKKAFL